MLHAAGRGMNIAVEARTLKMVDSLQVSQPRKIDESILPHFWSEAAARQTASLPQAVASAIVLTAYAADKESVRLKIRSHRQRHGGHGISLASFHSSPSIFIARNLYCP